jgi:hypothetical protein
VRLRTTAQAQYTAGHATQALPPAPRVDTDASTDKSVCISMRCAHVKERCSRCNHADCALSLSNGVCAACLVARPLINGAASPVPPVRKTTAMVVERHPARLR